MTLGVHKLCEAFRGERGGCQAESRHIARGNFFLRIEKTGKNDKNTAQKKMAEEKINKKKKTECRKNGEKFC